MSDKNYAIFNGFSRRDFQVGVKGYSLMIQRDFFGMRDADQKQNTHDKDRKISFDPHSARPHLSISVEHYIDYYVHRKYYLYTLFVHIGYTMNITLQQMLSLDAVVRQGGIQRAAK